jgi:hypothetical protein
MAFDEILDRLEKLADDELARLETRALRMATWLIRVLPKTPRVDERHRTR